MASPTYALRALVLKKTKLSETDLIITLLAEDGSLKRGVAKGARKPKNTFASRLELFSDVQLLMVAGKSLDIISEVQVINARGILRSDVIRSAAGMCALELFCHLAQEDLPGNRLFALGQAYLDALESATDAAVPALCVAELLKALGVSGFTPAFSHCVFCGRSANEEAYPKALYSFLDGGPVCSTCTAHAAAAPVSAEVLTLGHALLYLPFSAVLELTISAGQAEELLQFCGQFIEVHCQARLKSLVFFQTVTIPLIFA